jgi:hypothetical protein
MAEGKGKQKERKKEREKSVLFISFLVFLHESRILFFFKNNMENIKHIPTTGFNSVSSGPLI